ncbi:MAG TPA: hypothetical protein VEG33_13305 [Streptosporangiaceae bacterium]|nr:hypothetical protein [Streptosporangiaceae bacterium]
MGRGRERGQGRPARPATQASRATGAGPAWAWRQAGAGVVLGCAALLAAGCSGGDRPAAAAPASASQAAPAGQAISPAQRKMAARSYLAIALPANRRLETDFDGLKEDGGDLAAAQADLRDAAATEREFDRRLLALKLPPATEAVARRLVTVNEARARLATAAAASTSLSQLHGYQPRLTAANKPVEDAVRVIRRQLGLPPPETS